VSDISNTELLERVEQLLAAQQEERFIRLPEVQHITGMGRSSVFKRISEGLFAEGQILSGSSMRVWRLSEINSWVRSEIEAARQ